MAAWGGERLLHPAHVLSRLAVARCNARRQRYGLSQDATAQVCMGRFHVAEWLVCATEARQRDFANGPQTVGRGIAVVICAGAWHQCN